MTNCFDMTDSIFGESCAMYLALARLNHSCCPNVQQTHYPDTTEEVLYASRDIKTGDEINDCYIDLRQSKASRQSELWEYYRFRCSCEGCCFPPKLDNSNALSLSMDDNMRMKASQLIDTIISLVEEDEISNAFEVAKQSVSLLEDERFMKWSIRYIAEFCMYVYQIGLNSSINKKKEAQKYLHKAHQLNILLQGTRSPDSRKTSILLEQLLH